MTGGSIFAGLAIWGLITGRSVPTNIAWPVLGTTLILASFLSWRKQAVAAHFFDRQIMDFVPEDPTKLFENYTSIQAEILFNADYTGKWMKVFGKIADLSSTDFGAVIIFETRRPSGVTVYAKFGRKMNQRLSILQRGDTVSVIGKIKSGSQYTLWLNSCELGSEADTRLAVPPTPIASQSAPPPSPESS